MKKFLLCSLLLCAAGFIYAQKPVVVAVCPAPYSGNFTQESDDRVKSLINEYFKSELATHSRINIADSSKTEDARMKIKWIPGQDPTAEQIKEFSKLTNSGMFCLISLVRMDKDNLKISATIYQASDTKKLGTASATLESIDKTDEISKKLANQAAKIIHGKQSQKPQKAAK